MLFRSSDKFQVFADYYNVNETGYWEHENYILLRKATDAQVADRHNISEQELSAMISDCRILLLAHRNKRVRPGLDDKQLTSWNALMIKGYCDAYEAFGEGKFLNAAARSANHILKNIRRADGGLNHNYKNGRATINGYLEDYAFMIESLVKLYEITFEERYLEEAKQFADYAIKHFFDHQTGLFFFT